MSKPTPQHHRHRKTPKMYFFMAVITLFYMRDEKLKERPVNILLELPDDNITQDTLQSVQKAALQRLHQENNVEAADVKDAVITNIVRLAHCRPSEFHPQMEDSQSGPKPKMDA